MKLAITAVAGLITIGAVSTIQLVMAQGQQPVPVAPQQNDRRAAIAKISPNQPIQIRVINRTNAPIVTSIVSITDDRPVASGQSTTFGRLHTSYLPLPLNLQVSLQNTPDPNKPVGVSLDVTTAGNEIIVGVKSSTTSSGNSSQTVDINAQGLIYIY
jgi:hypothetical protein